MRYLVICYEFNTEASAENRQLFAYDTENEAVKKLHSVLYQDMSNENISKSLVVVMNEYGNILRSERYDKDALVDVEE